MRQLANLLPKPIAQKLRAEVRFRRDVAALRTWGHDDKRRAQFYSRFISDGDIVFDVGANIGNRSKIFLHLGARVIAFEPQLYCLNVLRKGLGGHAAMTLEPIGLGACSGTVEMNLSDSNTISSMSREFISAAQKSGRFGSATWNQRILVQISTIDAMVLRYGKPSFIKIDVEGYELDVISGMSSSVKALSFEFTPDLAAVAHSCIDRLTQIGFTRFQVSLGESMSFALSDWVDSISIKKAIGDVPPMGFGDIYALSAT